MYIIIDDSDKSSIKVLDTSDNVIDSVSLEQLKQLRKNKVRFYNKTYLRVVLNLYPYLVKAHVLGKLNDIDVIKHTVQTVLFYGRCIPSLEVPDDYTDYHIKMYSGNDFIVLLLKHVVNSISYVYTITNNGIFYTRINGFIYHNSIECSDCIKFSASNELEGAFDYKFSSHLICISKIKYIV